MKMGARYLLFLARGGEFMSADYCGNSGPASEKQAVLGEVRALGK